MRQETIIKTYITFDELTEEQQRKVIDKNRHFNIDHTDWYEFIQEDFHALLELLGYRNIESEFSGFWSQGDGASFKAVFDIPKSKEELQERMKKLEDFVPLYFKDNKDIKELFLTLDFSEELEDEETTMSIDKMGRSSHECTMYCYNRQLQEFSRYIAARYYNDLEQEYEHLTSDEAIKEMLVINDYEFDADTLNIV